MKTRVLIVDDSFFMRAAIKKALEADPRFEVIAVAKDGREGVDKVIALGPDVVTMDFNMPVMDGIRAVREIMARRPTPVVMLSAHTVEGARETFDALAAGAVDFLTKPSGEVSADLERLAPRLIAKLLEAAQAAPRPAPPPPPRPRSMTPGATWPGTGPRVVVIGISTGGPAALSQLLPQLPGDLGLALLVVQHMPAQFTQTLAERLDAQCAIEVREAREGDRPRQALALIAPGDHHLDVGDAGKLHVVNGPEVNNCRPSVDVTMKSAARVFGRRSVGLLMTGMGRDGAEGMAAIKAAGGVTLAQDRGSSVIWGMPKAAIETGAADEVVALSDLAARLVRL
jgi:two-component system, chemotaxis family, protein-glutamate methylesterase/glutaminase